MPSSAREEAERLVAAFLAMASNNAGKNSARSDGGLGDSLGALGDLVGKVAGAALGHGSGGGATSGGATGSGSAATGGSWATGSAECCVCPVCRVIAAMRDPSPDAAAMLAIGAGDLAHGVTSMMRALSAITGERPSAPAKPAPAKPSPDEAWSAATRKGHDVNQADEAWVAATNGPAPDPETDPWGAASAASAETVRAERRAAAKAAAEAAAEAARRVQEAADQARAARAKQEAAGADVAQNTTPEVAPPGRTTQRFDVWAAATAADLEREPGVDHDDRDGEGELS
jgi:hypothetical protein